MEMNRRREVARLWAVWVNHAAVHPENLGVRPNVTTSDLSHGLNFLFHSFGRRCNVQPFRGRRRSRVRPDAPASLERASVCIRDPFWEPVVGILLVFGLGTRSALAARALLLVALLFGTSLRGIYSSREARGPHSDRCTVLSGKLILVAVTLSNPAANRGIDGVWPAREYRGSTGCRGPRSLDGALPAS
jgi:hypothetical protein